MHIKIEDILTVTVDAICPSQPGSSPPPRQPAEISCVHLDLPPPEKPGYGVHSLGLASARHSGFGESWCCAHGPPAPSHSLEPRPPLHPPVDRRPSCLQG